MLTRNESESSLLLNDIELIADFFVGEPAAERTISLRSGRQVAVQVPYGVTTDCDVEGPVEADLAFTYRTDEHPHRLRLESGSRGPTSSRRSAATVHLATLRRGCSGAIRGYGGRRRDRCHPARRRTDGGSTDLVVTAVSGTILVDARTSDGWQAMRLVGEPVTIPLTFVVNRCDPRPRRGDETVRVPLVVSVDGAEPVDVAVDVGELVADLETIVEQCTAVAVGE